MLNKSMNKNLTNNCLQKYIQEMTADGIQFKKKKKRIHKHKTRKRNGNLQVLQDNTDGQLNEIRKTMNVQNKSIIKEIETGERTKILELKNTVTKLEISLKQIYRTDQAG